MITLKRHLRLWKQCIIISIVRETQFRGNFFATFLVGLVQTLLSLIPLLLIFDFTGEVNGWTRSEAILLNGIFLVLLGLLDVIMAPNANRFGSLIQQGTLDLMLIRPVNAQWLTATRYISPDQIFNVLLGLIVLIAGWVQLDHKPGISDVLAALVIGICGVIIMAAIWIGATYIAFWTTRVEAFPWMVRDIFDAGRFPLQFFPVAIRVALSTAIPVAFISTFPAEAMLGRRGWELALITLLATILVILLLIRWWHIAVRRYSSASS